MTQKFENLSIFAFSLRQVFFSMSIGGGGLTTLASYNNFHDNTMRDTAIVALTDRFHWFHWFVWIYFDLQSSIIFQLRNSKRLFKKYFDIFDSALFWNVKFPCSGCTIPHEFLFCSFTSIFAGFTVFSILGFISHTLGKTVEEVRKSA